MGEAILKGVLETIEILMDADPEHYTPEGQLLTALADAVCDYEDFLYPELEEEKTDG